MKPKTQKGGVNHGMSREINLGERKFWIVSEPEAEGWRAQVLEVDVMGDTLALGIETTAETRTLADERALGELQHRFREQTV